MVTCLLIIGYCVGVQPCTVELFTYLIHDNIIILAALYLIILELLVLDINSLQEVLVKHDRQAKCIVKMVTPKILLITVPQVSIFYMVDNVPYRTMI